jgi:transposase
LEDDHVRRRTAPQLHAVAPFVMEGAMNGLTFVEWVRQFLVPTLKRRDVVIMDNLPSHKVPGRTRGD